MKTPQVVATTLAKNIGIKNDLYLKREDLHPYGSHKGRSIPIMIKNYVKNGVRQFVVSSSGNAALAAIHTVEQYNKNNPDKEIALTIFVGTHIEPGKLQKLKNAIATPNTIDIQQVDNPKQRAFQQEKEGLGKNLRQSTDDMALEGYTQLAEELNKIDSLSAIFIPTSSGTTAQALGAWFAVHNTQVQIHIVQSASVHPIAANFDTNFHAAENSVANAIVDTIAHRSTTLSEIIRHSRGSGWVVSDDAIRQAIMMTTTAEDIVLSPNSALAVAGLIRAKEKGWQWPGPLVCLITGA
jgi:threonine dehydratase